MLRAKPDNVLIVSDKEGYEPQVNWSRLSWQQLLVFQNAVTMAILKYQMENP